MANTTFRTSIDEVYKRDPLGPDLEVNDIREIAVSVSLEPPGAEEFLAAIAAQTDAIRQRMSELTLQVEAEGGEVFPAVQRTRFPDAQPAEACFRIVPRRVGEFVVRISLLVANRVLDVVERRYLAVPAASNRRPK